jgi:AcrR family transcriptional regulator
MAPSAPAHVESPKPRAGKRECNKAENRAAILAAGRRVFADIGYETATIRHVIRATQLSIGTFYNYFPDKESVLRALLEEKLGEMQRRAQDARRESAGLEDVVRSTIDVSFCVLGEDREVFELLRRNAGTIRVLLNEPGFVDNRDSLTRDIEAAVKRGGGPAIDAEYLSSAIGALVFEVAATAVDRRKPDLDAAAEFTANLVLGGIACLPPAARKRKR